MGTEYRGSFFTLQHSFQRGGQRGTGGTGGTGGKGGGEGNYFNSPVKIAHRPVRGSCTVKKKKKNNINNLNNLENNKSFYISCKFLFFHFLFISMEK